MIGPAGFTIGAKKLDVTKGNPARSGSEPVPVATTFGPTWSMTTCKSAACAAREIHIEAIAARSRKCLMMPEHLRVKMVRQ